MEKMKQSKRRQVFVGILSGSTTWVAGFLLSGFVAFVEINRFSESTSFLGILFPFLLMFLCITLALVSSKNSFKHFFIAFETVLLIPLISLIPGSIFSHLSDKLSNPPFLEALTIAFMMLCLPFISTVVIGTREVITAIPGDRSGMLGVLSIVLMVIAAIAPIVGLIVYWKKSKTVKESSENISDAVG